VRTGGRYAGARGGGDRTWLLIKHRDEWAGDLDITEFAPKSVKSGGDFEDILAQDNPAIWQTNRPAKGGDTGAMFATIIERAARLKAARTKDTTPSGRTKDTKVTKDTKAKSDTKGKAVRVRATSKRQKKK
jgi:hypothetical protein